MGAPIIIEKMFTVEPYRSIINLLAVYPDGLELKDIQYAIMDVPCIGYNIGKIQSHLGEKLEQLIISDKIKKYQSKQINRSKEINKQKDESFYKKGKRVRSNLENFLNKMIIPPNNAIYLEDGRYKLHKKIYEMLFIRSDKQYIDELSQLGKKKLKGGRINIYGLLRAKGIHFDPLSEINTSRFNKAVENLRKGIDELQSLMNESISDYIFYDTFLNYINDEKYPLLDRNILKILHSFLLLHTRSEKEFPLNRWFDFKNDQIVVVNPDRGLTQLFKKHFYPDKKVTEIKSMLGGHVIAEDLATVFFAHFFMIALYTRSHIVAVVHSGSGHFVKEIERLDQLKNIPSFAKDTNKLSTELIDSYKESNIAYFESMDRALKDQMKKAKLQQIDVKKFEKVMKDINEGKIQNVDDLLNIYKIL